MESKKPDQNRGSMSEANFWDTEGRKYWGAWSSGEMPKPKQAFPSTITSNKRKKMTQLHILQQ